MGNWTGTQLRPQRSCRSSMRALKPLAATGLGVVHLVHDDDAGDIGFFGIPPNALGDRLNAILGVDDDDGGLDGEQGGAGFVARTCGSRGCRQG